MMLTCVAAALVQGLVLIAPSIAHAQTEEAASCSFLEIQASNDGKGIDPKLSPLKKKLEKPPFSAWAKFELQKRHDKTLTLMKSEELRVANEARLEAMYREYTKGKKERFKLRLTLRRKDGKKAMSTDATVDAGDYLVISMPPKDGKSYLLAITCKK
jgi:hypothetical protein